MRANKVRHPRDLDVGQTLKVPTPKGYVVKKGDTLYSIGRRFGVPVGDLKDINGLASAAHLHPGQKIDLPGSPAASATACARPRARRRSRCSRPRART